MASITRFCYKTHNYKGLESSYGYKMTNKVLLHQVNHKFGISRKATLCKDFQNSFDITSVTEGALEQMVPQCKNLVLFLEKFYSV